MSPFNHRILCIPTINVLSFLIAEVACGFCEMLAVRRREPFKFPVSLISSANFSRISPSLNPEKLYTSVYESFHPTSAPSFPRDYHFDRAGQFLTSLISLGYLLENEALHIAKRQITKTGQLLVD